MKSKFLFPALICTVSLAFISCASSSVERKFFHTEELVASQLTSITSDILCGIAAIDGEDFFDTASNIILEAGAHTFEILPFSQYSKEELEDLFGEYEYTTSAEYNLMPGIEYTIEKYCPEETAAQLRMTMNMISYTTEDALSAGEEISSSLYNAIQDFSYKLTVSESYVNSFTPEKGSEYSYDIPDELLLERDLEVLEDLPEDKKYSVTGTVEYTINTSAPNVKTMPVSVCLNRVKSVATAFDCDAIYPCQLIRTHNPNHKVVTRAVMIKYEE